MSSTRILHGSQAGLGPGSAALMAVARPATGHIVSRRGYCDGRLATCVPAPRQGCLAHNRARIAAAASPAPIQQQAVYVDIPESQDDAVSD